MDNAKLEKFKDLLTLRRLEILQQSKDAVGQEKPVELDQQRTGRLSRMDAMQMQAMSQEIGRRREVELARVDSALSRIESGDYGFCVRCEEDIEEKRLEIDPAAPMCVSCAGRKGKVG